MKTRVLLVRCCRKRTSQWANLSGGQAELCCTCWEESGNWCTHGTGANQGLQKAKQLERGGGGRGERCALWHSHRRESGGKQGSSTVFPLPFPFPHCWGFSGFLCFSIVQPSISPQQLGAPFLPPKTCSVSENLKLFQHVTGQQKPPRRNPKNTRWERSGNVAICDKYCGKNNNEEINAVGRGRKVFIFNTLLYTKHALKCAFVELKQHFVFLKSDLVISCACTKGEKEKFGKSSFQLQREKYQWPPGGAPPLTTGQLIGGRRGRLSHPTNGEAEEAGSANRWDPLWLECGRHGFTVPDNEIRAPMKSAELRFYSSSARECGTFEGRGWIRDRWWAARHADNKSGGRAQQKTEGGKWNSSVRLISNSLKCPLLLLLCCFCCSVFLVFFNNHYYRYPGCEGRLCWCSNCCIYGLH